MSSAAIFEENLSLTKFKQILMNKGELITRVADDAGVSKAQATAAVDSVFDAIERSLKKRDKAAFVGLSLEKHLLMQ